MTDKFSILKCFLEDPNLNQSSCKCRIFGKALFVVSCFLLFSGCSKTSSLQPETEPQSTSVRIQETEAEAAGIMAEETEAEAAGLIKEETEAETALCLTGETETEVSVSLTEEAGTEPETEEPVVTVYVDDEKWDWANGFSVSPDSDDDVRVYITIGGYSLLDLPFGEAHTVLIHQRVGSENLVRLTGEAVYMERSTCEGNDCVNMGEVTRENMEMRVLGGFIICLPNMISVEVRSSN